jgi:hypothetical protein
MKTLAIWVWMSLDEHDEHDEHLESLGIPTIQWYIIIFSLKLPFLILELPHMNGSGSKLPKVWTIPSRSLKSEVQFNLVLKVWQKFQTNWCRLEHLGSSEGYLLLHFWFLQWLQPFVDVFSFKDWDFFPLPAPFTGGEFLLVVSVSYLMG